MAGDYESLLRYCRLLDAVEFDEFERVALAPSLRRKRRRLDSDATDDEFVDASRSLEVVLDEAEAEGEAPPAKRPAPRPRYGLTDASNPLEALTEAEFALAHGLGKRTVREALRHVGDALRRRAPRRGTPPVPELRKLLIVCDYLTKGSSQKDLKSGVSQPTVSRIIAQATHVLAELRAAHVAFPPVGGAAAVSHEARYGFPGAIGCVAALRVGVNPGKADRRRYLDDGGRHSLLVQVAFGPSGEILDVDCDHAGGESEARVYAASAPHRALLAAAHHFPHHVLLASDAAYAPAATLMTPLHRAARSPAEWRYEAAHARACDAAARLGEWTRRFGCLRGTLACDSVTQRRAIVCCAVLHNIAVRIGDAPPPPPLPPPTGNGEEPPLSNGAKVRLKKRLVDVKPDDDGGAGLRARDDFIRRHFSLSWETDDAGAAAAVAAAAHSSRADNFWEKFSDYV